MLQKIVTKTPYVVEKFDLENDHGRKRNVKVLKGRFVKTYRSFLLFEDELGIKECFSKRTFGIDWAIKH